MPHTRSQGEPEFELTSPEQILRARHHLEPKFKLEEPEPTSTFKLAREQQQFLRETAEIMDKDKLRDQKIEEHDTLFRNQQAGFLDLQRLVGELAKRFDERPGGAFRANTETNPRRHVKAVTTRSGRGGEIEQPPPVVEVDEEPVDEEIELETTAGVPLRLDQACTAPISESSVERLKREKMEEKKRGKRVEVEAEDHVVATEAYLDYIPSSLALEPPEYPMVFEVDRTGGKP
ncbi:hypothetical protein E3N88_10165 [Mikania micrantha]|uniref:Uncharacterized protein n=1 Tax=Mikania micrantha TaxID=192012 RepID=A0A5N6PBM9_9ASTR|nr:hypothetical protein E3N88_10165 [Mikania micrantha]